MSTASRKLFLLHLVANALLLWLGYEWLGVGESTRPRLLFSALDALAILALACWFHGATLVYFRAGGPEPKINGAFRTALRHLPALLVAAALKPDSSMRRALATSHTLGSSRISLPECRTRKDAALACS